MRRCHLIYSVLSGSLLFGCGGHHEETLPSSVAVSPIEGPAVFVVNGGSHSISVLDAAQSEVVATIELKNADYPHHAYLSRDSRRLLVAVPGMDFSEGHGGTGEHGGHGGAGEHEDMASSILLLDSRDGATLAAKTLEQMNHNAIFSPDEQEIWTSQMTSPGSVLVLDAQTLDTKTTIPVGDDPAEVTFSDDGRYAFVANGGSDSISVIDVSSKMVVDTMQVGDTPVGAWPGSNGVMYVDNEADKSLTAIDASSLSVLRTYDLGFTPAMAAVSPDGNLWVTDTENGRVVIYSTEEAMVLGEMETGDGAHAIVFSPDGQRAYVTNQHADTVSVIDVAARAVIDTVDVGSKPNGIVFRPAL